MEKKSAFFKRFLGKGLDALIENKRDPATGYLKGMTSNYIPVVAPGPEHLKNKIVKVNLEELRGQNAVFGTIPQIDIFNSMSLT